MRNKKIFSLHVVVQLATFAIIAVLFSYFRLKPMIFQTVGYTYDQGRDFLKAAEIVLYHNPTFIGPTTGIQGVFHGAWWFYILSVEFFITRGLPIGFYYSNFAIQFTAFVIFAIFTRRYFGFLTSAILSFLVATAGHFIFTSIFIANNVMSVPSVLMVAITTTLLLEKKYSLRIPKTKWIIPVFLLAGMAVGFVSEFEFAFGLMLVPSYLVLITIFHFTKKIFRNIRDVVLFLIGLGIPFIPRLLFELKNAFPQTKILIDFVFHPKYFTPKPYVSLFHDRQQMFKGYFESLFLNDTIKYLLIAFLVGFLIYRIIKKEIAIKRAFIFMLSLTGLLFIFSTFYKDTFWSYYYDGIQNLFLFIGGFILSFYSKKNEKILNYAKASLLTIFLILGIVHVLQDTQSKYVYDGIRVQQDIVEYIHSYEKSSPEYCVQIFTPPVIPYTYNYIFLYKKTAYGIPEPKDTWIHKSCWLIIEYDDNNERRDEWIKNHIPRVSKKIVGKQIKDVRVELWRNK